MALSAIPGDDDGYEVPTLGASTVHVDDLSIECIDYLREVVRQRPEGRQMHVGVSAASKLLDWATRVRSPERAFLALFGGDTARAMAWLRDNSSRLLETLKAQSSANSEMEGNDDGRASAE